VLKKYLYSSNWQLGFKKKLSCNHAIYAVRKTVDYFVKNESTVNICALDISKAFDKINQHCLLLQLSERRLPVEFLLLFELWFTNIFIKVKWCDSVSRFYRLKSGIRQGGILSPIFFAIYVDKIVSKLAQSGLGCYVKGFFSGMWLYADDVVLLSASVSHLQTMIQLCISEFDNLDLCVNVRKSNCIRIGKRFNARVSKLVICDEVVVWNKEIRYLGLTIKAGRVFRSLLHVNKQKFFRAANCILSRIGCKNVGVLTALLSSKCFPIILFGLSACALNKSDKSKLDNSLDLILAKMFGTYNKSILKQCLYYCGHLPLSKQYELMKMKFLTGLHSLYIVNLDYYFLMKSFDTSELQELFAIYNTNRMEPHGKRRFRVWVNFELSLFN
jgi:hypothetical protein